MSTKTGELRDIFVSMSEDTTIIEEQQEHAVRDPLEAADDDLEREVSEYAREDGLDDALEGTGQAGEE